MRSTVLVDTGFLVALFNENDCHHSSAMLFVDNFLRPQRPKLVTVWPTVVEACFFLDARGKRSLLEWLERGAVMLRMPGIEDLPDIRAILDRYADIRADFADACLIWLAGVEKTNRILTTDRRDFDAYRTPDGRPFERLWLAYGA